MQHEDKIPLLFGRIEETPTLDTRHIGYRSHKAMGDMLALYMRQQVCEVKRRQARPPPVVAEELWPIAEDLGKVPRLRPWNAVRGILFGTLPPRLVPRLTLLLALLALRTCPVLQHSSFRPHHSRLPSRLFHSPSYDSYRKNRRLAHGVVEQQEGVGID